MKRNTLKGYIILIVSLFVTLLTFRNLTHHDAFFQKIHGSYIILALGFIGSFVGAYLINRRSYPRYDHIQRANLLRHGRPFIVTWNNNVPSLNYEAILLQALEMIHRDPNKPEYEIFDDNYPEISAIYETLPEDIGRDYIKELRLCLRSYL